MMSNWESEVIDLTDSFTLVNHNEIANIVIELDDSVNDNHPRLSLRTTVQYGSDESLGLSASADVTITGEPKRRSKKKESSKKKRNAKKSTAEEADSNVRDRSPLKFGDCPICFDELGKNSLASTKCGHVFCLSCLEKSMKIEKKCPTCRQSLRGAKSYHPLYLTKD